MGRWDRRASRLANDVAAGTVVAAVRADVPSDSLEGGLRSVAGSFGARLGRSLEASLGRRQASPTVEQTAVAALPDQGYLALLVGADLVLLDPAGADGGTQVVARWPVHDVALVSVDDVTSLTHNVTRIGVVFGDGSTLTVDAPRQGYARDIARFVHLVREAAGILPTGG